MHLAVMVCLSAAPHPMQCRVYVAPYALTKAACEGQIEARLDMVQAALEVGGYGPLIGLIEGWCEPATDAPGVSI